MHEYSCLDVLLFGGLGISLLFWPNLHWLILTSAVCFLINAGYILGKLVITEETD